MELKLAKDNLATLKNGAIKDAVEKFANDVSVNIDRIGLYNETISRISLSLALEPSQIDFWIAESDGEVKAFLLADIVRDMDGRLAYWFSHPWIDRDLRDGAFAKESWQKIRERAKALNCARMAITTSRHAVVINRMFDESFIETSKVYKSNIEGE